MPPTPSLKTLRAAIDEDHTPLKSIIKAAAFRRTFGDLGEEGMLTRPPRGYDADHPAADLLRHKSFIAHRDITSQELLSPKLPDIIAKYYAVALPLVRWINTTLGYRPATRR
jgi:uncharacterized protein (DUF2461 family)